MKFQKGSVSSQLSNKPYSQSGTMTFMWKMKKRKKKKKEKTTIIIIIIISSIMLLQVLQVYK